MPLITPLRNVGVASDREEGVLCRQTCRNDWLRGNLDPPRLYGVSECEQQAWIPPNTPSRLPCKFRRWQDDVYGVYKELVTLLYIASHNHQPSNI